MEPLDYELEQYDFKKAMQQNVNKFFAKLLYEHGFTKYKNNRFVRERNELAQIISFSVGKYSLRTFAMVLPLCYRDDHCIDFGIELASWAGFHLLDGKYYAAIGQHNYFDKEIQYRDYCENHKVGLKKTYLNIEEGVIPEMDEVDSLKKLADRLETPNPCIFGWDIGDKRPNDIYTYTKGFSQCLYGDFDEGISILKKGIPSGLYENTKEMKKDVETLICLPKEEFMHHYHMICDEMRKYYKLKA